MDSCSRVFCLHVVVEITVINDSSNPFLRSVTPCQWFGETVFARNVTFIIPRWKTTRQSATVLLSCKSRVEAWKYGEMKVTNAEKVIMIAYIFLPTYLVQREHEIIESLDNYGIPECRRWGHLMETFFWFWFHWESDCIWMLPASAMETMLALNKDRSWVSVMCRPVVLIHQQEELLKIGFADQFNHFLSVFSQLPTIKHIINHHH